MAEFKLKPAALFKVAAIAGLALASTSDKRLIAQESTKATSLIAEEDGYSDCIENARVTKNEIGFISRDYGRLACVISEKSCLFVYEKQPGSTYGNTYVEKKSGRGEVNMIIPPEVIVMSFYGLHAGDYKEIRRVEPGERLSPAHGRLVTALRKAINACQESRPTS